MGGSIYENISLIIYIDPKGYFKLPLSEKYSVARVVGKINKTINNRGRNADNPFRAGTLGHNNTGNGRTGNIFRDQQYSGYRGNSVSRRKPHPRSVFRHAFLSGHGGNEYLLYGHLSGTKNVIFNTSILESMPNLLEQFAPEDSQFADVIRIYNVREKKLILLSDVVAQEMVCFFE